MFSQKIYIYGAGAHGKDIKSIIDDRDDMEFCGWFDDDPIKHNGDGSIITIGEFLRAQKINEDKVGIVLGVNWPHQRDKLNVSIQYYSIPFRWIKPTIIHPSAYIHETATISYGSVIGPMCYIGPDCNISSGVHVGYGTTMTRTQVNYGVTICPGVTVCGDVVIKEKALIGAGATVCNLLKIGKDAKVGAGMTVKENIDEGDLYV